MVFQTFDRMIFGTLTFPGTRWYVLTVRDPQMVRSQKKFGNHCFKSMNSSLAQSAEELWDRQGNATENCWF